MVDNREVQQRKNLLNRVSQDFMRRNINLNISEVSVIIVNKKVR